MSTARAALCHITQSKTQNQSSVIVFGSFARIMAAHCQTFISPEHRVPWRQLNKLELTVIVIDQLRHPHLNIDYWHIARDERWCVLGRNGAGKQYIDQLLLGKLKPESCGDLALLDPEQVRIVSFEVQQAVYEEELKNDDSDFMDEDDPGRCGWDFLPAGCEDDPLIDQLHMRERLDTGYRLMSTGESRKLLILQAVFEGAQLLICDNPYDSLDKASCIALEEALGQVGERGTVVMMLVSNRQDIPDWCDKVAWVDHGKLDVLGEHSDPAVAAKLDEYLGGGDLSAAEFPDLPQQLTDYPHDHLVALKQCTVTFGGRPVLDGIDVTINPLQHTLITGPNGSGKSTLLGLITGDCPQCFSNHVEVVGFKRGSGESVWDVKSQMGIVSADLHRRYRVSADVLTVVLSGFFDSIGLYEKATSEQAETARQWLRLLGVDQYEKQSFHSLSYGEQRVVLIARALVKGPLLLVLDEPTQGLDEPNRHALLSVLERIASLKYTTILLVSHRDDEMLPLFGQHIALSTDPESGAGQVSIEAT